MAFKFQPGNIISDRDNEQLTADNAMLLAKTERQDALLEYVAAMSDVELPEEPDEGDYPSETAAEYEEE